MLLHNGKMYVYAKFESDICINSFIFFRTITTKFTPVKIIEGPKGGRGGVCVRVYEENKPQLRFTKIIDSHLRFTKIIRKYIGIYWFSFRKHVIDLW